MSTMVWKFPGTREARLWTLKKVEKDTAYLLCETGLAVVAIDLAEGVGIITMNDIEGGRVRAFAAKETLCQLVEGLVRQG